MSYSAR
ncbi:d56436fa-d249-4fcf-b22f-1d79f4a38a5d [Thermothielavioides terrestris]|nr:28853207-e20b-45c1-a05b-0eabdd8a449a [Thermothielavioides terrestris]SPQ26657.1 d56436fa-d249-4fcf-b22f-1d79f4a38a5d [Thermothielavioides terrestris]